MTITSAYQSVSVTVAAFAVSYVTVASADQIEQEPVRTHTPPPAAPPPAPPADTVRLSKAAWRADSLMAAVDANEDGAISKEEFTDGALALLRRGRSRHLQRRLAKLFDRVDANDDGDISKEELMSALQRVSRHHRHCRPCGETAPASNSTEPVSNRTAPVSNGAAPVSSDTAPASSGAAPAPGPTAVAASATVTSVTVVAVAVKQYAAVAQAIAA